MLSHHARKSMSHGFNPLLPSSEPMSCLLLPHEHLAALDATAIEPGRLWGSSGQQTAACLTELGVQEGPEDGLG